MGRKKKEAAPVDMIEGQKKALETAIDHIQKKYGKGAVMLLDDSNKLDIEAIPTGSMSLDIATGIGGVPRGRVVELYGPESGGKTTLALHIAAEAQKAGGTVAFIDAEHALDPNYAKRIGVDTKSILISQPDSGEQALEICSELASSGALTLIVVDSVAALTPDAEIRGEMGDSHVALQARLMSQALRKITAVLGRTNTTVIFINQLREKVGIMFGCLHADTMIPFTNGEAHTIREIVDNKIHGRVWAFDENTKQFIEKEIIDWHYNGEVNDNADYIHIETEALETKNGNCGITVTPDHLVMTDSGWKPAKELLITDRLLTHYKSKINGTLADFLYGTLCGDSHISVRAKNTAALKFQDNKNPEYVGWKISKLNHFFEFKRTISNQYQNSTSQYSTELALIKNIIKDRDPLVLLRQHYSDMGLAVWYMDDGNFDSNNSHYRSSISVKRYKNDKHKLAEIQHALSDIGLICTIKENEGTIIFDKNNTIKLFKKIHTYVPECMQYKLGEEYRDKYIDFALSAEELISDYYVAIKSIRTASDKQMKQRGKYDLTVQDCHNYLAGGVDNGVLVHNSPETTPGGRALKFFSSMRIEIRKIDTLKNGDKFVGNHVRAKIVKNKVAPPFRTAEFDIMYGTGIDKFADILECAVNYKIVEKSGAWYRYDGDYIGQGKEKAVAFLKENDAIRDEIEEKVNKAIIAESGIEEDDDELMVDEDGVVIDE